MATKSSPLTLEDLMQAQQQMLRSSNLSESQKKTAEEQIEKLEQIRNSLTIANAQRLKEDIDLGKITDPKGDASHVTLGDVKQELRNLNANGDAPRPGRPQLPRMLTPAANQTIDVPAREIPDQPADTREAQLDRLKKIGSVIDRKTEVQRGGARNEGLTARNTQTFDKFIAETEKRDTMLADANADQVKIFERIEETLLKLREAGSDDSKRLREELAGLSGELSQTGDTTAKSKIGSVLTNAQRTAAGSNRGNTGTLGDAFQAAMGKKAVAKEGYTYDERTKRYHEFDAKTGKVGKMAKAGDAKMGRLAGAASILGNFVGNKAEEYVEGQRSERVQGFLDNFRSTESGTRGEQIANLQGQQNQLQQSPAGEAAAVVRPQKTAPKMVIASQGATGAAARGGSNRLSAQTLNITGQVIQLKAAKVEMSGGDAGPKLFEDSGTRPGEKFKKPEAAAAAAQADGEGGGSILGDALDMGKRGLGKAGGMIKGAGGKLLAGGKMLAGGVKGALGTAGGATLATGAALVAAPFLADAALGAFGVGKDKEGKDLVIDEKQDDANWKRASLFEKIQSAPARGIEKVGGLFGGNIASEARAKRIAQETEYLDKKQGVDQPKAEAKTPLAGKPVDPAKAQAAAKEQYQAAKSEETKAAEKLAAFEKENQFDYREKPTATQEFLDMPGTGKFKDPKKQAEYNKLQDAKYKAEEAKQRAGQDYTKAEGVTKTTKFGGGTGKMGEDITSAGAKINALKKRGYTDEQLGRDDSLTSNYVGFQGGAKYSRAALGKYEDVIEKELEGPAQGKGVGAKPAASAGRDEKVGQLSAGIQSQRDADKSKPVVITNNNVAPSTGGQTQTFARRGAVRPDESAMEKYANRNAHFF